MDGPPSPGAKKLMCRRPQLHHLTQQAKEAEEKEAAKLTPVDEAKMLGEAPYHRLGLSTPTTLSTRLPPPVYYSVPSSTFRYRPLTEAELQKREQERADREREQMKRQRRDHLAVKQVLDLRSECRELSERGLRDRDGSPLPIPVLPWVTGEPLALTTILVVHRNVRREVPHS